MTDCPVFKRKINHLNYYADDFHKELDKFKYLSPKVAHEKDILLNSWLKIIEKLDSPELITFLEQRLAPYLQDEIINQERTPIPSAASNYTEISPVSDFTSFALNPIKHLMKFLGPRRVESSGNIEPAEIVLEAPVCSELSSLEGVGISSNFYHDGYIAGGAIANLINEYLFKVPAVINDVDYFYYDHRNLKVTAELENEIYEKGHHAYRIKRTYRKEMINFVEFESVGSHVWKNLLDSFDLNCTMFGFHPKTKKILINLPAIEFLLTREIKINKNEAFDIDFSEEIWKETNKLPSFSSIIRAKRKASELNAFFPFNDYVKEFIWKEREVIFPVNEVLISHRRTSETRRRREDGPGEAAVVFISKKELKSLETEPQLFAPYFLFQKSFNNKLIYQNPPVAAFDFFKQVTKNGTNKDAVQDFFTAESYFRYYEPRYPIQDLKQIMYQRYLLLKKHNLLTYQTKRCFKEDLLESKLEALSKFLTEHTVCREIMDGLIKNFNWSFNRCCNLFLKIKKFDYLIGTFESFSEFFKTNDPRRLQPGSNHELLFQVLFNTSWTEETRFKELFKFLENIYQKNKEKNTLRNKISFNCYDKFVTELTLATELEAESRLMHHCVRGYAGKVRGGECRIFHLKTKTDESTLELVPVIALNQKGRTLKYYYKIFQHKSFNNRLPKASNHHLARIFTKYLNLQLGFTLNQKDLEKELKHLLQLK